MSNNDIKIMTGKHVGNVLKHRESAVLSAVRTAYETHACADSVLPNSVFLRFPGSDGNRIIALPAQLGGSAPVVGMKWVASFPRNSSRGLDRASAVILLNEPETGRPYAIIEGSTISAVRTAASAALASELISGPDATACCGVVGCGRINFEVVRFLRAQCADLGSLILYDVDPSCAERFKTTCERMWRSLVVNTADSIADVARNARLISFATTASTPHISDSSVFLPGSLLLHVSLRDLAPEVILACDNVVDDVSHVCRENTSVHLAEKCSGNREFIRCTLGEILVGKAGARDADKGVTIFSPFGLGILDLAVSSLLLRFAMSTGDYSIVDSFLPDSWNT